MSINKKVISIYIIAILLPAIIFTVSIKTINNKYEESFRHLREKDTIRRKSVNNATLEFILITLSKDPSLDKNLSKEYLDDYIKAMPIEVLIKNKDIIYKSDKFRYEKAEEVKINVNQIPYTLYINKYNHMEELKDNRESDFNKMVLSIGIFYILLHIIFIKYVSKIILSPIKNMKNFAIQMRKGNYDYSIEYHKEDEIKEVYNAFENMRMHLKKSEEQNIKYYDNRKKLIANISHDLKTPIAAISGYVDGIIDGVAYTPEKLGKYVKVINSYVKDMEKLINDLFLFSKLDIDKIQFEFKPTNLKRYFDDCVEDIGYELKEKSIQLDYSFNYKSNKKIKIDPMQLKRVITNIIYNSTKYLDKNEKNIELIINEIKDGCEVVIKDNGIGIEKNELENIFNEFYRVDRSRKFEGGSGLGLSIAKKIINTHEGEISIESELNIGTSIKFSLKYWEEIDEENINN